MTAQRICKRCLLRDMEGEALYETMRAYVDNLPPEQKADAETLEARLQKCRNCDHLTNGMCALCGCFVEVRAAKRLMHCAKSSEIW